MTTESDPSAVVRVLHIFQARNLIPQYIRAERLGTDCLQIEIEISGLEEEVLRLVVAKMLTLPTVITAVLCVVDPLHG